MISRNDAANDPSISSFGMKSRSGPYFQSFFPAAEFAQRRAALAAAIGTGTAVLQGSPRTGAFDLFRQHNDFFYLTGVETPHAYLTIHGRTSRSVLYLLPADPKRAQQEGTELSCDAADEAIRITGVDDVKPVTALGTDLRGSSELFVCDSLPEGRYACQDTLRHARQEAQVDCWRQPPCSFRDVVAQSHPTASIRDLSPQLVEMRLIKSDLEISAMRRAGQLTAMAICEAMRAAEPGIMEWQLAAVADYVFHANGASAGYRPIVACGANIWNMHYYRNNCPLVAGQLVLMDYAADYCYYTSDIGRMWPVSGSYEPWQRELYGFVVEYHQVLLELIAPGKTTTEIRESAAKRLMPLVDRKRWMRPAYADAARMLLNSDKQFTHTVGMTVHDVGEYRHRPLRPGIVFALDPQLWVPYEQLYIRVEDTVVVTDSGVENLTAGCPHELDAVERLIAEPGLIKLRPDLVLEEFTVE